VGAALSAGLWGWGQQQQLGTEQEKARRLSSEVTTAREDAHRNLATASELKSTLERERQGQALLLKLQGELRLGLAERERKIETLKHDNEELQKWADKPLPDVARRVRERPAITGADAYRQWLSGGGALHPAGDSPDPQRRTSD
jgi:LysB family phage lysis regulatory protein